MRTARSRHLVSGVMIGLTYIAAGLATLPLLLILLHLINKGASSLSIDFFTHMPRPVGEAGGGMANAIGGTLVRFSRWCSREGAEPTVLGPSSALGPWRVLVLGTW